MHNWKSLNDTLRTATEKQALKLLREESVGSKRLSFLLRIHARYNILRAEREKAELASGKALQDNGESHATNNT